MALIRECMETALPLRVPIRVKFRAGARWGSLGPLLSESDRPPTRAPVCCPMGPVLCTGHAPALLRACTGHAPMSPMGPAATPRPLASAAVTNSLAHDRERPPPAPCTALAPAVTATSTAITSLAHSDHLSRHAPAASGTSTATASLAHDRLSRPRLEPCPRLGSSPTRTSSPAHWRGKPQTAVEPEALLHPVRCDRSMVNGQHPALLQPVAHSAYSPGMRHHQWQASPSLLRRVASDLGRSPPGPYEPAGGSDPQADTGCGSDWDDMSVDLTQRSDGCGCSPTTKACTPLAACHTRLCSQMAVAGAPPAAWGTISGPCGGVGHKPTSPAAAWGTPSGSGAPPAAWDSVGPCVLISTSQPPVPPWWSPSPLPAPLGRR